jgi:hypothetical protein
MALEKLIMRVVAPLAVGAMLAVLALGALVSLAGATP